MKKLVILFAGFAMFSNDVKAATYDYSVEMKESDGTVTHMGDVQVNINQEGENAELPNEANQTLLNKIQNTIKSSYQDYNINVKLMPEAVILTGTVKSEQDKRQIEQDILKIDGVKKVDNRLQVGSLQTAPKK